MIPGNSQNSFALFRMLVFFKFWQSVAATKPVSTLTQIIGDKDDGTTITKLKKQHISDRRSEEDPLGIRNLADDVVADQETARGGEHPDEDKLQERRQPPGDEDPPLNEPRLQKHYDRDLNDVDGVDVFSECRLDAPGGVPAMLANDEQGNADADSHKRFPKRIEKRGDVRGGH